MNSYSLTQASIQHLGFLIHAGYIEPEVPTSAAVFIGTSRTVSGEGWDANPLTNVSFVQIFQGLSRDIV